MFLSDVRCLGVTASITIANSWQLFRLNTNITKVTRYRIHHTPDCFSHRIGGFSYTTPRQSGVTPLRFRGVKPLRFGGEVKINPIHSAPHSISCNCTNPMWFHSSWASQLLKTIDLDIAVQIDSVSCNCNQKWVHVNTVSCNCNENNMILTKPIRCEKQSGIV